MIERAWRRRFSEGGTLVGMVHLRPLPGAPGWGGSITSVIDQAVADATTLAEAGFDAVLVENFGDAPFYAASVPPETVAAMTAATAAVRLAVPLEVGVNVLRNDAAAALAVAVAAGAAFVRVNVHTGSMFTDQGLLEGRASETLRLRRALDADVAILADVHVKHATPPSGSDLESAAADTWHRGLADALLVTGRGTGAPTPLEDVGRVRTAVPHAPVLVASGVTVHEVCRVLEAADGVVVGSSIMREGRAGQPADPARARALVEEARS
jgi:membrane complex biogenesis BtpA family protein